MIKRNKDVRDVMRKIDLIPDGLLGRYPHVVDNNTMFVGLSADPELIYTRGVIGGGAYSTLGVVGEPYVILRYRRCDRSETPVDFDISKPLIPEMLEVAVRTTEELLRQVPEGRR